MQRFWILIESLPKGPFTMAEITRDLASGKIQPETLICPVGGNEWRPIKTAFASNSIEEARPTVSHQSAPGMPAKTTQNVGTWNPVAIAWLGLLFSPVWAGIMAAVNGPRLRAGPPPGIPIIIGAGSLALSLANGWLWDWFWLDVGLYLGAVWLLWIAVLSPQEARYRRQAAESEIRPASWTWPVVAGCPIALLVAIAFLISPLLPLEPRQVCERFARADTAKEMSRYTTMKLLPALAAMEAAPKSTNKNDQYELLDEGPAPPEVGGYLVNFRYMFAENGRPIQAMGCFHLLHVGSGWKIEDMFLTAYNNQPIEPPILVSRDFHLFAPQASSKSNGQQMRPEASQWFADQLKNDVQPKPGDRPGQIPPARSDRPDAIKGPFEAQRKSTPSQWWTTDKWKLALAVGAAFWLIFGRGSAPNKKTA